MFTFLKAEKLLSAVALESGIVRYSFNKMCSSLNHLTSFPFFVMSITVAKEVTSFRYGSVFAIYDGSKLLLAYNWIDCSTV